MANYIKIEYSDQFYYIKLEEIVAVILYDVSTVRIRLRHSHNDFTFSFDEKEEAEQVVSIILEAENGQIAICEKDIKKATLENLVKAISKITNNGEIDDKSLDRFDNLLNDK